VSEGEFPDDVSGPTAAPATSSGYLPRTPCKIPKTKTQYGMDRYKHYRQVIHKNYGFGCCKGYCF
jgi:hypothetical protein